jgi:hypothetical protein
MLFDLGGTAKSRNFSYVRVHRPPVHRTLAFDISKVYRLVNFLYVYFLCVAELVELRGFSPQNERASSRSHVSFCIPLPHFSPDRRGADSSKSMGSPLGGLESHFRTAESDLDALNTVDLGPKRPFSVGECALWARLTGPQLAAQVAAMVSLVEAPANH